MRKPCHHCRDDINAATQQAVAEQFQFMEAFVVGILAVFDVSHLFAKCREIDAIQKSAQIHNLATLGVMGSHFAGHVDFTTNFVVQGERIEITETEIHHLLGQRLNGLKFALLCRFTRWNLLIRHKNLRPLKGRRGPSIICHDF